MKRTFIQIALGFCLVTTAAAQTSVISKPVSPSSVSIGKPAAPNPYVMTPEEWQVLRTARQDALKANPDLMTKAKELSEKMQAFEAKLEAAMIKTDPNIAPIVTKFGRGRAVPSITASPQSK